jgi:hypothetical protein
LSKVRAAVQEACSLLATHRFPTRMLLQASEPTDPILAKSILRTVKTGIATYKKRYYEVKKELEKMKNDGNKILELQRAR